MADINGILQQLYDPTTGALRVTDPGTAVTWQTYTPTVKMAAGAGTDPALGSTPNQWGRWRYLSGKTVECHIVVQWGGTGQTGGTPTTGGFYVVSLPVAANRSVFTADRTVGGGYLYTWFHQGVVGVTAVMADPTTLVPAPTADSYAMLFLHGPEAEIRAKGQATVANGTASIVVTHGLANTPFINDITIMPNTIPSAAGCIQYWVSNVTATQFTINATGAAGANLTAGLAFNWAAAVLPDKTTGLQSSGAAPRWNPTVPFTWPTSTNCGVNLYCVYESQ